MKSKKGKETIKIDLSINRSTLATVTEHSLRSIHHKVNNKSDIFVEYGDFKSSKNNSRKNFQESPFIDINLDKDLTDVACCGEIKELISYDKDTQSFNPLAQVDALKKLDTSTLAKKLSNKAKTLNNSKSSPNR